MPIATKNNAIIVKDGKVAENCDCCGGWYCYGNLCEVDPGIPAWTCGGSNEELPPESITVSVQYSGQSLSFYKTVSSSDKGVDLTIQVRTLKAETSLSTEVELSRIPFPYTVNGTVVYGCAYRGQFPEAQNQLLTVWPGLRVGSGWGAAMSFSISPAILMSESLGEVVSADEAPQCSFVAPGGTQPEPPEADGGKSYTFAGLAPDTSGFVRFDLSRWNYSTTGPFFEPNPTLSGLSWSYSMQASTLCKTAGVTGLRIVSAPRKPAITISVLNP